MIGAARPRFGALRLPGMWSRPDSSALADAKEVRPDIDSARALSRIAGDVEPTPLVRLPFGAEAGVLVLGKMENRQVTGSFKARGALNNVLSLAEDERARGVVASSSGNHGRALAWAARRAGVSAAIVMPADAYPNKIEACRAERAEVVLAETREGADEAAAELASPAGGGRVWIHPYDRPGTVEGAGTVGLEVAQALEDDPPDAFIACVGGGGLVSGSALALRRAFGDRIALFGAEPEGAASLSAGLAAGEPVPMRGITSRVQGLTPPFSGAINVEIAAAVLDGVVSLPDDEIIAAQRLLVRDDAERDWRGETVEPAGGAALAAALSPGFAARVREVLAARGHQVPTDRPVRVVVTVSGGNPDPAQLAEVRA